MSVWINGRRGRAIDQRDRGFQYGDGVFETMRVRCRRVRLLDYHLDRLYEGCSRLKIRAPLQGALRGELERGAALRSEAVLKLIVTRGIGPRGYRPSGARTLHAGDFAASSRAHRGAGRRRSAYAARGSG